MSYKRSEVYLHEYNTFHGLNLHNTNFHYFFVSCRHRSAPEQNCSSEHQRPADILNLMLNGTYSSKPI